MSATKIALLGAVAGFTIFLGLPIGRLRNPAPRLRALLNAAAAGILLFVLGAVLADAWEPVDAALGKHDYGPAGGNGLVLAAGVGIGLLGLVYFDGWVARRGPRPVAVPQTPADGKQAPAATADKAGPGSPAGQLALLIAVGIGLHNFAEGLAIGNSAAGQITLAVLLVIRVGLHNATAGLGSVSPPAA